MSNKTPFEKFINKKPVGAKKKEIIRVEKKREKQEQRDIANKIRTQNDDRFRVVTAKEKIEIRSQKSEVRNQKSEFSGKNSFDKKTLFKQREERNQNSETRNERKFQTKKFGKDETTNHSSNFNKSQIRNPKPEISLMPLNKYIAHAGVCARREAAELVKQGVVKVNGDVVYEPGYKVSASDKIWVKDKEIFPQKNLVYILLNKPKDYITTAKDPEGRKTVFDLMKNATQERIYPVGRLDRNTTGVLLLTNDGELAQKLTHPSFEIKKIYEVTLDKPLTKADFEKILNGITLEDGFIKADAVGYADAKNKAVIGVEIHSGRNRIVRRIFEYLGYDVRNLDRVMFANLTKKNVDRGKWRMLNDKEIRLLKFMNKSFLRKNSE